MIDIFICRLNLTYSHIYIYICIQYSVHALFLNPPTKHAQNSSKGSCDQSCCTMGGGSCMALWRFWLCKPYGEKQRNQNKSSKQITQKNRKTNIHVNKISIRCASFIELNGQSLREKILQLIWQIVGKNSKFIPPSPIDWNGHLLFQSCWGFHWHLFCRMVSPFLPCRCLSKTGQQLLHLAVLPNPPKKEGEIQ